LLLEDWRQPGSCPKNCFYMTGGRPDPGSLIPGLEYSEGLVDSLTQALRLFKLNLADKSVLLKPNLIEYIPGAEANTNPLLIGAAAEALFRLGAKSVEVGEGPGHQRDTYLVLVESGLDAQLRWQRINFVDLNRDELVKVSTRANYTGLDHFWLPRTLLASDFVVSMRKIKTHHWAGVTLSMKNMFGVVPGTKYGWPKNILHWKGIHRSILDICATAPIHFVIADGVIAMEGNGPLHGTHHHLGKIILADDPVAADFVCARLSAALSIGPKGKALVQLSLITADDIARERSKLP
jgi:uncharacterized protein (DUF362 family)